MQIYMINELNFLNVEILKSNVESTENMQLFKQCLTLQVSGDCSGVGRRSPTSRESQ